MSEAKGKMWSFAHRSGKQGGMGYVEFPNAVLRYREELGLDADDVVILLAIMSHSNGYDYATVATSQLATDTGLGKSNVKARIKRLSTERGAVSPSKLNGRSACGLGILKTSERKWVGKNKSATTEYSLAPLADRLRELVSKPSSTPTPVECAVEPVKACSPPGAGSAVEPVKACPPPGAGSGALFAVFDEDGDQRYWDGGAEPDEAAEERDPNDEIYWDGAEPDDSTVPVTPEELFGMWANLPESKRGLWFEINEPDAEDKARYDDPDLDHRSATDVAFAKMFGGLW